MAYTNQAYYNQPQGVQFQQMGQPGMGKPGMMPGQPAMPPGPITASNWMPRPQAIPGCPPGLEYLTTLDTIQVEQIPSLLEAFTGWDTNNKYVLRNTSGQQFMYAMEETDTCMRYVSIY
jgi:hypothetical protein